MQMPTDAGSRKGRLRDKEKQVRNDWVNIKPAKGRKTRLDTKCTLYSFGGRALSIELPAIAKAKKKALKKNRPH